jgi:hypothetical protein
MIGNATLTIERIDEGKQYLGWFKVVKIVQVRVKIYFSYVFTFECTENREYDRKMRRIFLIL